MKRLAGFVVAVVLALGFVPTAGAQIDLNDIKERFRTVMQRRVYGFDFYNLGAGSSWAGEIRGKYGHTLADSAVGWGISAAGTTMQAAALTGAVNVSTLTSGTLYWINSSGGAVNITLNEAPSAGEHHLFTIGDATNTVTITVGANSVWGANKVFPAAGGGNLSKGQWFALYASRINAGSALKWAITLPKDEYVQGTFQAAGIADFDSSLDANDGADISGGALTFTGTGGSWNIAEADSALLQTGTGQCTFTGNVAAQNGLAVTGANLTLAGGLSLHGLGVLILDVATAAAATAGFDFTIRGSAGGAANAAAVGGTGGALYVYSGDGGAASADFAAGAGGAFRIAGAVGGAASAAKAAGAGGALILAGGAAGSNALAGGGNNGASLSIDGGNATGAGTDGSVLLGVSNTTAVAIRQNNVPFQIGLGNNLSCVHNATDTIFTSTTGDLIFDNTDLDDVTIFQLGTDTSATAFRVVNNTGNTLFQVAPIDATTGTTAVTGDFSYTGHKDGQVLLENAMVSVTPATWVLQANSAMQLQASQTDQDLMIKLVGLKVGDEITEVRVVGSRTSAANNVTIHGDDGATPGESCLVRIPSAAALAEVAVDCLNLDSTVAANTALDLAITDELTGAGAHPVLADNQYFLRIQGTTAAATAIDVIGAEVTINRK